MNDVGTFSEQRRASGVLATLHIHKRHAGGDSHVARDAQQARRQRQHRDDSPRPRVDRSLACAPRYASNHPLILLPANNLCRHFCAQDVISVKGTQAVLRKIIALIHDKREQHASAELCLQDLVWILVPLSSRGYLSLLNIHIILHTCACRSDILLYCYRYFVEFI